MAVRTNGWGTAYLSTWPTPPEYVKMGGNLIKLQEEFVVKKAKSLKHCRKVCG